MNSIYKQTRKAIHLLFEENRIGFNPIRLLVVGGSSSEIEGSIIGHRSTFEIGVEVAQAALDLSREKGFDVAFQCCEHLNRALIMEREVAEAYNYEQVWVVPQPKAGGSLATAAWGLMKNPVAVLEIRADAGLDIGQTMVGMHLRRVAVPIRLSIDKIGKAVITAARTRPMLIGGERAQYNKAHTFSS